MSLSWGLASGRWLWGPGGLWEGGGLTRCGRGWGSALFTQHPNPRGFSQALLEPPTQICSADISCSVGDAEIDSSIHSVSHYIFLSIYSVPDTVLDAGFTAGSQSCLTELPGKQVISTQCLG